MKKKTILIVPPKGGKIQAYRIRLSVAVFIFAFVIIGFAGYFIPFNSLSQDVVEKTQRKNLSDQNKKLLQRILSTLKLLNNLKDEVVKLETKKERVADITGMQGNKKKKNHAAKKAALANLSPAALLHLVNNREGEFIAFTKESDVGGNAFERIPVCKPVPGKIVISKGFGDCKDPFTGQIKKHNGIDFICEPQTPVIATANGTVVKIETDPIWGKKVLIENGLGFKMVYAHLGGVKTNQGKMVMRGETIGTIGISGLSTGPHVHYEIWYNDKLVNPEQYFFPSLDSIRTTGSLSMNN